LILALLVAVTFAHPVNEEISDDQPDFLVRNRRQDPDEPEVQEPAKSTDDEAELGDDQVKPTNRQEKQIPEVVDPEEEVAKVDEIEATRPETDRSPASSRKFVFHPYYGFVPATDETKGDKKTYVYNPYYGFVPSTVKSDEKSAADSDNIEYQYDPLYGYMPVTDAKQKEQKKFVYHSYFGFVPESQAEEIGLSADTAKKYVYSPYYGFVPAKDEVDANTKEVKADEPNIGTRISIPADAKDDEQVDVDTKEARERYHYHPYSGFVKVGDEKESEHVKFLYDPLYGYFQVIIP